jgi:Rhodopirellula transposase DDE domain
MAVPGDAVAVLAAKFAVMRQVADERTWRVYLGSEARALGRGGIVVVARAAGVSETTVAAGVAEIEAGRLDGLPPGRSRRPGGGRRKAEDAQPGLTGALRGLVEAATRGDPVAEITWCSLSLRDIGRQMAGLGFRCGKDALARMMREDGYSLQGMSRTIEGRQHPDRDAQFRRINAMIAGFRAAGDPVVSVDAKKKEQLGPFWRAGRTWRPAGDPVRVRDHDFPDQELGKITPYGIYDIAANRGFVSVGTSCDTAAFAVSALRLWWKQEGSLRYPGAGRLLVTCDAGGSSSYKNRAWKDQLAALAAETGLQIWVCHFPPGTQCRCLSAANYRGMEREHLGGHPAGRAADLARRAEGVLRGRALEAPVGFPQAPDAVAGLAADLRGQHRHELPDLHRCRRGLADDAAPHVLEDLDEGDAVRVDPLPGGQPHDDPGQAVMHRQMRPYLLADQFGVR